MAKTQTSATMPPAALATGQSIHMEDVRAVCEMLNYAFGYVPCVYFDMVTAGAGWATSAIATHAAVFGASGAGYVETFRWRVWIDPDVVTINVGATVDMVAANTATVRFRIGSTNTTISYTNSDDLVEKTSSVATASTGTGWQTCYIDLQHDTGADTLTLVDARVEGARVTSSLPSPVNE